MRNFTFNGFKSFKSAFLISFFILISYSASAQFYTKHYIAPAPWQYFSKANEIVIATNSVTPVTIEIFKSDGTLITNSLTAKKGTPAVYRFAGFPRDAPAYKLSTVLNGAGLIVTGSKPISINLRNVASDALGSDGSDKDIKGNAALTSFGDAGIGIRYRIGYYRDGSLGNFGDLGDQRPIYSIMAITDNTSVKLDNVVTVTLKAGQSYLFTAPIGTLVESSNPSVMNTSAAIDTPDGCGDGAFNQIPPESVLGTEYFLERGTGNNTAEQTTVVATKDDTNLTVESYSTTGTLVGIKTVKLAQAGKFYTFINGVKDVSFTASHIIADKRVAVYSGTAQKCEVDISTIAPVSECGGSKFIETAKFRNYGTGTLDYFGYILLRSQTEVVNVNGNNIANVSGVSPRYQIGTTGWYLINFNSKQIGSPDFLTIESEAKLTVSIVQQDGGFSMAGFFSNFAVQPEEPTFTYISGGGCSNNSALLKTEPGLSPYQWYLNGVAIAGANSDTYTAVKTGAYSVASTLTCGAQTQSKPVSVTLCTDLGVTKTVDNPKPCVGSNVEFTVKLSNLGVNNATGVSINDLLPTGYAFVSSTQSTGSYNSGTGVWSIGDVNGGAVETLKIIAKVNASGVYTNEASLPVSTVDSNSANNKASVSTTPNPLPTASITGTLTACLTTTLTAVTNAASPVYVWYKNNLVISGQTASTLVVNSDGDYKVKVTNSSTGCETTSAASTVKVSDTDKPVKPVLADITAQCSVTVTPPTTTDNCAGTVTGTTTNPLTYTAQGTYNITWSFNDGNGNVETAIQKVIINDTQKPTITCPATVVVSADANSCTASGVVLGTPTTSDNCTGTITVTNNAPSVFQIGNTTVTWTAKDAAGNTQTCTQTVTVNDTQKPTITCPATVVVSADANSCTASGVALGTPTTSDNCTGTITVTNNAPSVFPIGNTTVTWTAKDAAGNTQTCTQTVTVNDTQKPTITCPATVVVSADANLCTASGVVLGTPTTSDNCTGIITVTNNAPSVFPIGNTTVTWTAKDAAGNTQTCTQTVTVNDTQKPTITCPATVVVSADANSCTASGVVLGTPTTSDNCTGTITVTNNAPSVFPIGNTTVTWTAKDAAGNTQTCTQTVTVNDTQKPTITCPATVVVSADANLCTASGVALGTPTTSDNCTGTITVTNNAPSVFPIGNTTVTWTAKDAAGNTQTCTQTVKVVGPIIANEDKVTSINGYDGGTAVSDVLANDLLNCNAVVRSEVVLTLASTLPSVLTFDTTSGTVTVKPNTPAGTYSFDYKICEVSNSSNCSTATVEIKVAAPAILAVKENLGPINGTIGGKTTSLIASDKLNGVQAVIGSAPGQVTLTATAPTGLTVNTTDGTITVSAGVKAGNYDVEYTICDNNNAGNCSTATSTVVVTASDLVANLDAAGSVVGGNTSQTLINVFDNDTKNGAKLDPSDVKLTPGTDPKGYLTIDANGNAVLGANAPAGNYELTYEICEILNPANCSSNKVEVTVTAPAILAVKETLGPINGTIGGTTTSLIASDKLNGVQAVIGSNPGQVTLTATAPAGLTVNTTDGTVTVSAGVKAGNYDVEYTICDNNNLGTNCSTTTSTVVVTASDLVANLDAAGSVVGGNTSQTLINVFDNDTKNGTKLDPSDVKLTPGTDPKGYLTIDANGNAVLGANAPAGNYELTYEICEILNPTNCSSNKVQVTVTAPAILAVKENLGPINGTIGGKTTSLIASDKLNNIQAVIGSNPGQVTLTATAPAGLTVNTADGTVTVSAGVKAGNYDVEYTICDNNNLGTNCSTAISKVVVTASDLVANLDAAGSVVGGNTSQTLINVFDNDTKNGAKLDPSDVKLTPGTDPKGYLTIDANGNAVLGANAPAGNYELTYEICEILNPANCSSNKVQVTVTAPAILAVKENLGPINGTIGGKTTSLIASDKLNGVQAVIGSNPGQVTLTATAPTGLTVNTTDGTITVSAGVKAGNYDVEYTICDNNNAGNCSTATSTVVVTASDLVANLDAAGSVVGGNTSQTLINVFDNDTKNGAKLDPSDVKLTPGTDPKGYLTIDANGNAVLGANAPAGNYELTYEICEILNPANCSSNKVQVTVTAPAILAVKENLGPINGTIGGKTTSLIASDKLNNIQAVIGSNPGQVTLTATAPAGLTVNTTDGTVTVSAGVKAGNYDVEYTICDNNNAGNCSTAISTVVVTASDLVANLDAAGSVVGGNTSQTLINVFDNDTKNGAKLDPSDVKLTPGTDPKGYLTIDANGNAVLGANAPAGNYELTYEICEILNPANCSSNKVEVTVTAPAILAVKENLGPINGTIGGKTTSLIASDKLNGVQAVIGTNPGQVTLTATAPAGLTVNTTDGTVTVSAGVKAGNYDVEYTICDNNNAGNCSTAISTVVVTASDLVANLDAAGSVVGGNTSQTLINVFDNDTKNGAKLDPSDVKLTPGTDPKGYLTIDANGNALLGANAPAGNYELTYEICEILNPANCSSNKVEVTVGAPAIDAVAESLGSVNGSTGGKTTDSVIVNDKLNGVQAVVGTNPGQVILTKVNLPAGFVLESDGRVTVPANTPIGTYEIEYSICEVTNPANCDTAKSTVEVTGGKLIANPDSIPSIVGINQPRTVVNVFANDTNNGLPVVPSDVKLSVVTPDPKGYLTLNPDGTVTLGANAPRGTYELTYQICEILNPSNCSSATIEVTVEEPTITVKADSYCSNNVPYVSYNVVADNFTPTNLLTIKWIDSANNVVATQTNLPLSGSILWPGAVIDGNGNGIDWPGWLFVNDQWIEGADGFENTKTSVKMEFSVNPTASIVVNYPPSSPQCNARPTFVIAAKDDTAGPVDTSKGTNTGTNIFDNDKLNGVKVNPADVILTTVIPNANLVLNANGAISVKAGTPSGTYQLTYQICDAANPSNCSQAIVKVVVSNSVSPIDPLGNLVLKDDALVAVDGINGSLEFVNVLDNDLLKGLPINPADVIITNQSGDSNFEFNADGTVNVKPNTPGKTYTIVYQVCEKANPTNCSTATLHVFVEVPAIALVKTAVFNDENNNDVANAGETITYKFKVTNTGNVPLTGITITDLLPGLKMSGQALDLNVGESNDTNFSGLYKITQTDINSGKVTNQATVQGKSARGVAVEDASDYENTDGDKPTVLDLNGCKIKVFNSLSPNGDQKNERFYIQGLECYPDNTVEIYNRWGILVFDVNGYNNEDRAFRGYSYGRTTLKQSEGLPAGTYFYILKYKDSDSNPHETSGYLYISK